MYILLQNRIFFTKGNNFPMTGYMHFSLNQYFSKFLPENTISMSSYYAAGKKWEEGYDHYIWEMRNAGSNTVKQASLSWGFQVPLICRWVL